MSETPDTFTCEECGGTFDKARSEQEAEAEAALLFGVQDAASDPSMATVCGDCFNKIMNETHGETE